MAEEQQLRIAESIEERLHRVLIQLAPQEKEEVVNFAESFVEEKKKIRPSSQALSDEDSDRRIALLDAVTALSKETGPAESNREHDTVLYGTP